MTRSMSAKWGGGGEATAEESAEVAPGGQVAVVLQRAGDGPVGPFVIHQGHGIRVVHGLSAPVALQDRVEAVRERIVELEPEARVGHVGGAAETQMPLAHAQPASAGQALARHEQVAEGTDKVVQFTHRSIDSFVGLRPPQNDKIGS